MAEQEGPKTVATAVKCLPNLTFLVSLNRQLYSMRVSQVMYNAFRPGLALPVHPKALAVVGDRPLFHTQPGPSATFVKLKPDGMCEIIIDGATREVHIDASFFPDIQEGARVALDQDQHCVVRDMGLPDRGHLVEETPVTWADIGGCTQAIQILRETIEQPVAFPELFKAYGKRPPKGILLEGPPGCGKTLLGKATASALTRVHTREGKRPPPAFYYVKGPELLNSYVGETERAIRELFTKARRHFATHGYSAVIFFDEADALLPARGRTRSSDVDLTIVPAFLAEMDGMDTLSCIVLLATNRSKSLDSAVTRDGRVDRVVRVARPTAEETEDIFVKCLNRVKCQGHVVDLAEYARTKVFSDDALVRTVNIGGEDLPIHLRAMVSGALVAGIVDRATSHAMQTDIARESTTASGIGAVNIDAAVAATIIQNQNLNHAEIISELLSE